MEEETRPESQPTEETRSEETQHEVAWIEDLAVQPMSRPEMRAHVRQRIRAAKLEQDYASFAVGLLDLADQEDALKARIAALDERLVARAGEVERQEQQMITEHNRKMQAQLQQSENTIKQHIAAEKQAAQDAINAILQRKEQAMAQLNKEVADAEKRRDDADKRTAELNAEAKQLEAKSATLQQTIANRLKDEERKVEALREEQNNLARVNAEMRSERDAMLRRFAAP